MEYLDLEVSYFAIGVVESVLSIWPSNGSSDRATGRFFRGLREWCSNSDDFLSEQVRSGCSQDGPCLLRMEGAWCPETKNQPHAMVISILFRDRCRFVASIYGHLFRPSLSALPRVHRPLRAVLIVASVLATSILIHIPAALAQGGLALEHALREALNLNPNTLLQQQQVITSQGAVSLAVGQFDSVVGAMVTQNRELRALRRDEKEILLSVDPDVSRQITDSLHYSVSLRRTLQYGVTLGTTIGVTSVSDNLQQANGIPPQTTGEIRFDVLMPLLRSAGRDATTANLTAAEAELSASRWELVFANAQTLLDTTVAYWDYLARHRQLEIAHDSEQRLKRLVEETRKLIAADELPAADIQLVLASYAERRRSRISAEQALAEARRNLILQIGLPWERATELPLPADDFPDYDGQPLDIDTQIDRLQELALARRADLQTARQREDAARRRVVGARSGLKPKVDLNFAMSYGSLTEQRKRFSLSPLFTSDQVGPSITATLAVELPWDNSIAKGAFLVQSAALDSNLIRVRHLSRTIVNNVSVSAQRLARSAGQLIQSIDETRYYRQTVENERTKRRLGLATLIDVINVEDRLNTARLSEVQAYQVYATAIAQLRFELGTIVSERNGQFEVVVDDLFNPRTELPR